MTAPDLERARRAYAVSRGDPVRAIREAEALIAEKPGVDAEIVALSAIGLAKRMVFEADVAVEFLERAADLARSAGNRQLLGETLRSLAFDYASGGDIPRAVETIQQAKGLLDGDDLMKAELQHAFVMLQAARYVEGISLIANVLDSFDIADPSLLELIHGNRGSARLTLGRVELAIADHHVVYDIATANDHPAPAADAALHLAQGYADLGQMPTAMHWQGVAGELYDTRVPHHVVGHMERAIVLIEAGLYEEATGVLESTIPRLEASDGNELMVRMARVHLIDVHMRAGRTAEALQVVESMKIPTDNSRFAPDLLLAAARVRLANRVADDTTLLSLLLDDDETEQDEGVHAMAVRLEAVPLAIRLGAADTARQLSQSVAHDVGGLRLDLLRAIANAALAVAAGDFANALLLLDETVSMLDRLRATLGATELRLLVARQGHETVDLAVGIALAESDPELLFTWLERNRASTLTLERMAHTPAIDVARVALRKVAEALEHDPDNPDLLAEVTIREADLANVTRTAGGTDHVVHELVALGDVVSRLEGRTLVMFFEHEDRLGALVADGRDRRIVDYDELSSISASVHHVAAGLRRVARGAGSTKGIDAAGVLVRHHLERLRATLLDPLGSVGRMLIVPSPTTEAIPWVLLGEIPVEVTPSVRTWLRPQRPESGTRVVVAGPGLTRAEEEVTAVAETLGASVVRTGQDLLASLDNTAVLHVSTHATPRYDNPMFSFISMDDGPVRIYDFESVGSSPRLVVLAACDAAASSSRAGSDVMGLGTAFLGLGSASVVAPLFVVSDEMTTAVMAGFYEALVAGLDTAQALARVVATAKSARERFTAGSFICLGRAVCL